MLVYILLIAVVNYALGFALAVVLESRSSREAARPGPVEETKPELAPSSTTAESEPEEPAAELSASEDPAPSRTFEIPSDWRDVLEAEQIQAASPIHAAAVFLRSKYNPYIQTLLSIEDQARDFATSLDESSMRAQIDHLKSHAEQWINMVVETKRHLIETESLLESSDETDRRFLAAVTDQVSHGETVASSLDELDIESDAFSSGQKLINVVGSLASLAHDIRDRLDEILARILSQEPSWLQYASQHVPVDQLTELPNRLGFESLMRQWWSDDPQRHRMLSIALLDLDHFQAMNERWGTSSGDQILAALTCELNAFVANTREVQNAGRFGGDSFFLMFADTGPKTAINLVEQLRQTIAATTFEFDGGELNLLLTCSVTGADSEDTTTKIFERLQTPLSEFQQHGGNRSILCSGNQAAPVDPLQLDVEARVISIPEDRKNSD